MLKKIAKKEYGKNVVDFIDGEIRKNRTCWQVVVIVADPAVTAPSAYYQPAKLVVTIPA